MSGKLFKPYIIYCVIKQFKDLHSVQSDDDTDSFCENVMKKFSKTTLDEKNYYLSYANCLIDSLVKSFKKPKKIVINAEPDKKAPMQYDLMLTYGKENSIPISFDFNTIGINNIIANKFMKPCGFKKNSNVYKAYHTAYNKINNKVYEKIKDKDSFSEIKEKFLMKNMYDPITNLLVATLQMKRKCASNLYHSIFDETPRVLIKLMKSRYVIYDFSRYQYQPTGFSLKKESGNELQLKYKKFTDEDGNRIDGPNFKLTLNKNSTKINPILSMKYTITMINMNKLFLLADGKVKVTSIKSTDKKKKTANSKTQKKAKPQKKSTGSKSKSKTLEESN